MDLCCSPTSTPSSSSCHVGHGAVNLHHRVAVAHWDLGGQGLLGGLSSWQGVGLLLLLMMMMVMEVMMVLKIGHPCCVHAQVTLQ